MNSICPLFGVSLGVRCVRRTKNSPNARSGSEHLIWECSGNYSAFEVSSNGESLGFRVIHRIA
jgi:hypothetical protein